MSIKDGLARTWEGNRPGSPWVGALLVVLFVAVVLLMPVWMFLLFLAGD